MKQIIQNGKWGGSRFLLDDSTAFNWKWGQDYIVDDPILYMGSDGQDYFVR